MSLLKRILMLLVFYGIPIGVSYYFYMHGQLGTIGAIIVAIVLILVMPFIIRKLW